MSVSIHVKNVVKRYGQTTIIPDLSVDIENGEFFTLLGPSGCGKTTLLRMIAGFNSIEDGTISFDSQVINAIPAHKRNIGMVFQNYAIFPHLTVRRNVEYGLQFRDLAKDEATRRVEEILKTVRIEEYQDRLPERLSGGQQQRVALARAIVVHPSVLLMDEPLSNLDAKLRVTMRAELKHLHHELRVTTIYVTHDQMEAMTLASRIAVMNKGIIMQLAVPEVIYNDPANLFVAGFIGSPSMNLLDGALVDGTFRSGSLVVPALGGGTRDRVVLGVRPEDVSVVSTGTGLMDVPVYAFELTGESVLVTVTVGDRHLSARGDRHFRCQIGDRVGISFPPERAYLFDAESQDRIRL